MKIKLEITPAPKPRTLADVPPHVACRCGPHGNILWRDENDRVIGFYADGGSISVWSASVDKYEIASVLGVITASVDDAPENRDAVPGESVAIYYHNHQGVCGIRNIIPRNVTYGSSKWHQKPQWLLESFDVDKGAERTFALADVLAWGAERVAGYEADEHWKAKYEAAIAEVERLKGCLEPGTAEAIVSELFHLAERHGCSPYSSDGALAFLEGKLFNTPPKWPTLAGKTCGKIDAMLQAVGRWAGNGLGKISATPNEMATPETLRFIADFCEWREAGQPDMTEAAE